ncbi:metallophosphoesterase family protein [Parafilimonas terrae]|uniref:3',5'-cyclic AMP phosphodiesterase CpdA n=1 Tax=Parafilimonas terrae TaxID=1465490 RepID=A0A1I5WYW5_9BACT|nr:metallophosphoesterase [Parafilimonas terrae]SFQ24955.1 3',5'-cyclic AMP phosphodiesterase CpdA [Parafilimonas terrae]
MQNRRSFLKQGMKAIVMIGAGNALQSFAASSFRLPAKENVLLRFATVSDGHYGQPSTQYEALHSQMVNWLNAEQKTRGLDFTFVNGDLFHNDTSMMPLVKQQWDKLQMPYHVSHGNHDMIDEELWRQMFTTKWHYSFEKDEAAFIVLNTADEKGKYICPDLEFTKEQLNKYADKKHLFVFMHITPFNWTGAGLPCPELVAMFNKQSNLKAVFQGHDHDEDGMKENEGKHYFFDSHVAGNWGTKYHGYRIVEILKNGKVLTYQMNPLNQQQVNNNTLT